MTAAYIRRLTLNNFRNYRAAAITAAAGPVVLVGPNGAGKTNLIEAISFLTPGRGLRRATLAEVAFAEGDGSWAVSAEVEGALGLAVLGTGIEAPVTDEMLPQRQCRVDREPVPVAAFADHLRILWLTPAMDTLFAGPASERRRFLDRFALALDPEHTSRVSALERSLRSRNRLLEDSRPDPHWLDAIEHETAELAVAVAAPRSWGAAFPSAEIALDGWMEQALAQQLPAVDVEDRYRAALKDNRARDAQAGRTLEGPHLTDLAVRYAAKDIAAADASTGEQKALLIGLVLAHAALVGEMTGTAPLLLLDEVIAHLDPERRAALYDALAQLGSQVWMTGADPVAFAEIAPRADVFEVRAGQISKPAALL